MTSTETVDVDPLLGPASPIPCCWVNGRWTTMDRSGLSIATQALHYGTGVFEGIRSYWNAEQGMAHVLRLDDHVGRFFRGCRLLRIDPGISQSEMRATILSLVERSGFRGDLYIRPLALKLQLSPGTPFGVGLSGVDGLIALYAIPMPSRPTLSTVRCSIASWRRVPSVAMPPQAKITGSYANIALAVDEARSAGYDDAILLNTRGTVAEASTSNIFALHGDTLSTPSRDSDLLPGITRDCVLQLAGAMPAVDVREVPLTVADLLTADEVVLAGTGCELVAVTEISGRPIGTGDAGPFAHDLLELYRGAARGTTTAHEQWRADVSISDQLSSTTAKEL